MTKYTQDGLYLRQSEDEENLYYVGITETLIDRIGDLESVTLPENGEVISGNELFSAETLEDDFDFRVPFWGDVVEVNEDLLSDIDILNNDPEHDGYVCIIEKKISEDEDDNTEHLLQ